MQVPLLDLKAQYQTLKGELEPALLEQIATQYFILGPAVKDFEEKVAEYLGAKHALGVSSGTDALLLAMMALEIGPGDEVIVPDYSFFSTAGTVVRLNATPVLVDVDPLTCNIDPSKIEEKITSKTKAIVPVHLYGQGADMDAVMEVANKHSLYVIEDAAQALGAQCANGKTAGTIGHIGCYSFFPTKNLGAFGDAGLVTTNDEELAQKMTMLRVHGAKPKYHHKFVGGNFRLDAIQAVVLDIKLKHLNSWSAARRANAHRYNKLFQEAGLAEGVGMTEFNKNNKVLLPKEIHAHNENLSRPHIYNQYVIKVKRRDELKAWLKEEGIGTEVYYPVPFYRQECFAYLNARAEELTNSEFCATHTLALPVYPELEIEQQVYVVNKIKSFV